MCGAVIPKTTECPLILEAVFLSSFNLRVELHPNFNIRRMGGSQTYSDGGAPRSQSIFCRTKK